MRQTSHNCLRESGVSRREDIFLLFKIENKNFKATKIDLKKLLKSDPDFKEYYNSGEERYDQDEVDSFDVYNELVVHDVVLYVLMVRFLER